MGVEHYMKPGLHQKTPVRIITVNIKERYIEAALKDGAMVHVLVSTVPPIFQWPKTGEVWIIWRENGYWKLGERVESPLDDMGWVESLEEGDTQITGRVLIQGNEAGRKHDETLSDLTAKTFVVNHNLNTYSPNIVLWESPKSFTIAQDHTDSDTTIWYDVPYFGQAAAGFVWFGPELVKYTAFSANSGLYRITGCTRGYGGTTPSTIEKGTKGYKPLTPVSEAVYAYYALDSDNMLIEFTTALSNHDSAYVNVTITA